MVVEVGKKEKSGDRDGVVYAGRLVAKSQR
jgi:hypothetical protein